jgi:hypothetical protein
MNTLGEILRSKNQSLIPTFHTQDRNRKPLDSIKRAFLKDLLLSSVQYKDGMISYEKANWKLILDQKDKQEIEKDIAFEGFSSCLMSFQHHTHGYYVVVRKLRDKKAVK